MVAVRFEPQARGPHLPWSCVTRFGTGTRQRIDLIYAVPPQGR